MQSALKAKMLEVYDLGIIPEFKYEEILENYASVYDFARSKDFDYAKVFELAWLASECDEKNIPEFKKLLADANCYVRYWAAIGLLNLKTKDVNDAMQKLLQDSEPMNRVLGCIMLAENLGNKQDAVYAFSMLLDFTPDKLTNSLRAFIITEISDYSNDKELITKLRAEDAEAVKLSKRNFAYAN